MAVYFLRLVLGVFFLISVINAVFSAPQQKQQTTEVAGVARVQDPKCRLPKEEGPCRMKLDRYYFNTETNSCELFKFGGCRGNDNKFGFLKTCEDACVVTKTTPRNVANSKTPAAVTIPNAKTPPAGITPNSKIAPAGVIPDSKAPDGGTIAKTAVITPTTTTTKAPIAAEAHPKATKPIK